MITFHYEGVKRPGFKHKAVSQWIKDTAAFYGKKTGDVSYIFCSDERILEVNREFLQHDYYTDIITFDYSGGDTISGDIFISVDTVKSNAEEFGEELWKELHRVMIHGILHLCGQNDKTPEERAEMTRKEDAALERIAPAGGDSPLSIPPLQNKAQNESANS